MQVQQETLLISSKEKKHFIIVLLHRDNLSMRNLGFEKHDSKKKYLKITAIEYIGFCFY
jgi:hypothetical protein